MSDYIDDYVQDGDPAESFQPGEDKQRVDLTEMYNDTGQAQVDFMVAGVEAFNLGMVSRRTASLLRLTGCEGYDPFPSERNARTGAEGFFTMLVDGFKGIIEAIIKYVRMAINWVMDGIKTLFGFRKSSRITKELSKGRDNLKEEFTKTLNGLGFPASEYNLEEFIGELPPGTGRVAQVTLMKTKMQDDEGAVKALSDSLPLFQQCVGKLTQASDKVVKASQVLRKAIDEAYTQAVVRDKTQRPTDAQIANGFPEANRLQKACHDVSLSLDITGIAGELNGLLKSLYATTFTNDELSTSFEKVKNNLQTNLNTVTVQLNRQNVKALTTTIQYLNARYVDLADDEIDLRKVNWKTLGNILSVDEATKVQFIAAKGNAGDVLGIYQQTAVDIRNFTSYCFMVTQQLNVVEHQVTNLVNWHNRATAYYVAMVLKDLDTLKALVKESKDKGTPIPSSDGNIPKLHAIKKAEAKTFVEKFAEGSQTALDHDIGNLQTNLNRFTSQIGWKP